MPIHDQGYRRYGGDRAPRGQAWTVIARAGIRTFFAKKAFLGLLLASWLPFIVRSVQIYASANFPQTREFLAVKPDTFRQFLDQQGIFVFFITVYAFLEIVTAASTMLALSSLSNSSRYVGILYAALVFFTQALYGVLRFVTGNTSLSWVSFSFNLEQVGDAIFRLPPRYDTPWTVSLLMIGLLIAGSAFVLERRVRGVEIVA